MPQQSTRSGVLPIAEPVTLLGRWHKWLSTPPVGLDEERAKIFAVMNYATVAGWVAYLGYMPMFVVLNLSWIAWVNVGVLVMIGAAFIVGRTGRSFESFLVCALCVLGHSSLVTLVLGWTSGFHFHIITVLQLAMLFRYITLRTRLYCVLFGAVAHMTLWQIAHNVPSWAAIPETTLETIGLLNVAVFLLITSGVAAYHGWVVSQHQAQLAEARDHAQAASKAKSAFLANMSHELRTPLNLIIGYSELILEEAEDLEQEMPFTADVVQVQQAGKHLLGLINDILDLSKIEAGRMDLDVVVFDLAALAHEIVRGTTPLAQKKGNELTLELDPSVGELSSDPTKVRQILLNLISNACKFTSDGEVTLTIENAEVDGRPGACIRVRDTGIGIEPEALERIFEEFSQADGSTTRQYGGTGLGLTITRRFAMMLGGAIEVSSEAGVGSSFTVYLPSVSPEP